MSKNPTRQKNRQSPETNEDPKNAGLDEKISDLTVKTKKGIEQHWKILVIAIVACVAIYAVLQIVSAVSENALKDAHARVFQVTENLSEYQEPNLEEIGAALAAVQGSDAEKSAYKRAVGFLLRRSSGEKKAISPLSLYTSSDEDDDAAKAKKRKLLEAAGKFAAQAASRFPNDETIQAWATSVTARVQGEKDKANWLPEARKYGLQPPGTVPAGADSSAGDSSGDGTK